jgi:hypothetical protein
LFPSRPTPGIYGCLAEALRTRHYSYSRHTEEAYLHWTRRFLVFHNGMAEMDVQTTMAYTLRIESWRSRSPQSLDRFRKAESIESVGIFRSYHRQPRPYFRRDLILTSRQALKLQRSKKTGP